MAAFILASAFVIGAVYLAMALFALDPRSESSRKSCYQEHCDSGKERPT